jgi:hypothetical protein
MARHITCDVCKEPMPEPNYWAGRRLVIPAPEVLHREFAVKLAVSLRIDPVNNDEASMDLCDRCAGFIVLEALATIVPGGLPALNLPPVVLPQIPESVA